MRAWNLPFSPFELWIFNFKSFFFTFLNVERTVEGKIVPFSFSSDIFRFLPCFLTFQISHSDSVPNHGHFGHTIAISLLFDGWGAPALQEILISCDLFPHAGSPTQALWTRAHPLWTSPHLTLITSWQSMMMIFLSEKQVSPTVLSA